MEPAAPRVVLIESEPATRQLLEQSLMEAGCLVAAAGDAESGLELIARGGGACDAVVTAATLPDADGYEVCCVLQEYLPATPVILLCDPVQGIPEERHQRAPSSLFITRRADPVLLLADVRASVGKALRTRQQLLEARRTAARPAEADQSLAGMDLVARARSLRRRHVAPPCPRCGSDRVVPIVYGAARLELISAYATGRVALGGARKSADAPTWQCRDCDCRWST